MAGDTSAAAKLRSPSGGSDCGSNTASGGDPLSLSGSGSWASQARYRRPNYPPQRSSFGAGSDAESSGLLAGAGTATHSQGYNTFHAAEDPSLGLSTVVARHRLLRAVEGKIEDKERSRDFTHEFRDPFTLLLVLCAIFRFADYLRQSEPFSIAIWEAVFLFGAAALNVALNGMQRRRHHDEMAERVRTAIQRVITPTSSQAEPSPPSSPRSPTVPSSHTYAQSYPPTPPKPAVLLPSTSLIACYRDNEWQRMPMNLLVEGDIVALMSGDEAPGSVRALEPTPRPPVPTSSALDHDTSRKPAEYARGTKIPASGVSLETTRCNATFDPALLLSLCGDMRVFEMLETPVLQDVEDAFFRIDRPVTYTQKLQRKARDIAVRVCTAYSVLILLAIVVRVVTQHRSWYTTINHILLGPIGIWLCFASLNTPFVLFVAEAVATASILGSFEKIAFADEANEGERTGPGRMGSMEDFAHPRDDGSPSNVRRGRSEYDHGNNGKTGEKKAGKKAPSPDQVTQHVSDIYDSEDREKMRSEMASRQSAFGRSLEYFLIAIKFRAMRCERAHVTIQGRHLPIPFRSFRLLERLGSTTMLCCFDDDMLCEQTPSVEEMFLLNDSGGTTVLDLHPDRDCSTGLKFEDPKWRQHLPSLKPVGLSILLNDAEDPADYYHSSMGYLMNEAFRTTPMSTFSGLTCPSMDVTTFPNNDPYLRTCMQRLSAHVRMLPFPKHLLHLTREIGFAREDLSVFRRLQALHVICPRLAHHEHIIDHHDQNQEDTRYRGNLKTHLYSTVVQDQRSNRLQLLSRGHPTIALAQCSEYWDGKSICPLTSEKRHTILEMYNQWRVEDLDCVALSYVPVPHKLSSVFMRAGAGGVANSTGSSGASRERALALGNGGAMLAPVYLVEDSVAGEINFQETNVDTSEVEDATRGHRGRTQQGQRPRIAISPTRSISSADGHKQRDIDLEMVASSSQDACSDSMQLGPGGRIVSPSSRHRAAVAAASAVASGTSTGAMHISSFSDGASSIGVSAQQFTSSEAATASDSLLWQIQDDQIFLGMVASGVQPKRTIPDFIEDLTAAGIRFVYFSPRNMRRSKLLAEKMGIETDWNCAISLRPLDSDGPDPHRMTSNYSDWDVKARLPHGVEAIKKHLLEVDNVPLLVSLYTDSTPETISEMVSIFQDNDEVVMGVGSALKASNAALFSNADIAIALQTNLSTLFDEKIPRGKELPVFSFDDIEFSHLINTLTCSFNIKESVSAVSTDPFGVDPPSESDENAPMSSCLSQLIALFRLGRCMLTNYHQMLAFMFVSQLFLATVIVTTYILPFPLVPQLSCSSILWILWVLVPALSLCMLASPEEKDVMTRTPRKNDDVSEDDDDDLPRLTSYFVYRHLPPVLASILVFEAVLGLSLEANRMALGPTYADFTWINFVMSNADLLQHPRPPALLAAIDRAESAMLLIIGLSVLSASTSYLYRCESVLVASPLRNRMWVGTASSLLVLHIVVSMFRAGFVGKDGMTLWTFCYDAVPWPLWTFVLLWPLVTLAIDEAVKSQDRHHLTRYYKFLRMQFDTRLGMWSPK